MPTRKPKKVEGPLKRGSTAKLTRDTKGNLKSTLAPDFGGVTQDTMREDRLRRSGTGDGTYKGGVAPRVGGSAVPKSAPVKGGTKSQVKSSKQRVNKNAASPQAKRSAKRLY